MKVIDRIFKRKKDDYTNRSIADVIDNAKFDYVGEMFLKNSIVFIDEKEEVTEIPKDEKALMECISKISDNCLKKYSLQYFKTVFQVFAKAHGLYNESTYDKWVEPFLKPIKERYDILEKQKNVIEYQDVAAGIDYTEEDKKRFKDAEDIYGDATYEFVGENAFSRCPAFVGGKNKDLAIATDPYAFKVCMERLDEAFIKAKGEQYFKDLFEYVKLLYTKENKYSLMLIEKVEADSKKYVEEKLRKNSELGEEE